MAARRDRRRHQTRMRLQPLHYLTISEASSLIRAGTLSPVELTNALLTRIEALDPRLHAFITVMRESALTDARNAEAEIRAGRYRGPLHGIPIAHKDIVATKGVRTSAHSLLLKNRVPAENATVFERLAASLDHVAAGVQRRRSVDRSASFCAGTPRFPSSADTAVPSTSIYFTTSR